MRKLFNIFRREKDPFYDDKMEKRRKFVLKRQFVGKPQEDDLLMVEDPMPIIADDEFLVKMMYWSVDPYMRVYTRRLKDGETMIGTGIGKVVQSKHPSFPVGTIVTGPFGWKTHALSKGLGVYVLDNMGSHPVSYGLGILGMTGMSAYFGLLSICEPKAGETVLVNTAAGAVGSVVGQIAKIQGSRVVGCAGSDEKVEYLRQLGFDGAFNYKTVTSLEETLESLCPKGIDCFFDNVGGEFFDTTLKHMNTKGRIALCGAMSIYNTDGPLPNGPYVHGYAITKELKLQGFTVTSFQHQFKEAQQQIKQWLDEGKLKVREHVVKGFENLPKAFLQLLDGLNIGKVLVQA